MDTKLTRNQKYYVTRDEGEDGFRVFTQIPFVPAKCKNLWVDLNIFDKKFEFDNPIAIGSYIKNIPIKHERLSHISIETMIIDNELLKNLKENGGKLTRSCLDVPVTIKISVIPKDYNHYSVRELNEFVKSLYVNFKANVTLDYFNDNIVIEVDKNGEDLRIYVDENY